MHAALILNQSVTPRRMTEPSPELMTRPLCKCARCDFQSDVEEAFHLTDRVLGFGGAPYCLSCWPAREHEIVLLKLMAIPLLFAGLIAVGNILNPAG